MLEQDDIEPSRLVRAQVFLVLVAVILVPWTEVFDNTISTTFKKDTLKIVLQLTWPQSLMRRFYIREYMSEVPDKDFVKELKNCT